MSYVLNSYLLTYLSLLGGESWKMGVVNLAVLVCLLRTSTKKKIVNFFGKKVHPRKNPGYAYEYLQKSYLQVVKVDLVKYK